MLHCGARWPLTVFVLALLSFRAHTMLSPREALAVFGDENVGRAPASPGRREQMPERDRLTQTNPPEERLAEEARRLRKQAQGTPPGIDRERLVRRARQAEAGSHIFEWLNSRGENH